MAAGVASQPQYKLFWQPKKLSANLANHRLASSMVASRLQPAKLAVLASSMALIIAAGGVAS